MRKTKIICTLGPATDDEKILKDMISRGMNVARLNFSHGTKEEHGLRIAAIKRIREKMRVPIGILLDTKGPEIRIKTFKDGKIKISSGQEFTFTTRNIEGDQTAVSITYSGLPDDIKIGDRILADDGLIAFEVTGKSGTDITCVAKNEGELSDRKSINIPGISLNLPYVSDKDREDLIFGIEQGVDFVAASFCRSAYDIFDIKKVLEENGGASIQIIAKLENMEGIKNVDEILKACDGVMVARGDLGVEIDFEEIPRLQKMIIKKCIAQGKKVITATQMLESMIKNPRPTRAEISDVANAVYDGTSAVMLSGETSIGKYPVESIETMAKIALKAEADINYISRTQGAQHSADNCTVTSAIAHATCSTAHDLNASAIITFTTSGHTAQTVSSCMPLCPIIACATSEKVYNQLSMAWGVIPVMAEDQESTDDLFEHAVKKAEETGIVKHGDLVVMTAGVPLGIKGTTNILKVHIVGNVLVSGIGVGKFAKSGTLCVVKDEAEAMEKFTPGDILVIPKTSSGLLSILENASGIITETGGKASHAAIVGHTLDIPVICGAQDATNILKSGTTVTMDTVRGLVYSGVTRV